MPNRKPATTHVHVNSPPAADFVDPATLGQFLALLAILSSKIATVRLFEDTGHGRDQWFESPLPATRDLLPVVDTLLEAASADADELAAVATSGQNVGQVFVSTPAATTDPDALLSALQRLLPAPATAGSSVASTAMRLIEAASAFELPSARHPDRSELAQRPNEPAPTRDTTLDVVFDRLRHACHIELVSAPGLFGEDLAEQRRNAPPLPIGRTLAPSDLPRDAYLTAADAAQRLRVAKSTVTRRVGHNQLIGFRLFTRALRIPKDQFLGADVVQGIPELLGLFSQPAREPANRVDHKSAWAFLNSDLYHGDPEPRPIDRLRSAADNGTTDLVLADLARTKRSLDRGDHL